MQAVSKCVSCIRSSECQTLSNIKIDVGLLQYLLEPVSQVYLNCQHLELDVCAEI